jgi:hypothetical protein
MLPYQIFVGRVAAGNVLATARRINYSSSATRSMASCPGQDLHSASMTEPLIHAQPAGRGEASAALDARPDLLQGGSVGYHGLTR